MDRQMELDTLTYNRILADAMRIRLKSTEKGQEYLKDCWRFRQTEPDLDAIRQFQEKIQQHT